MKTKNLIIIALFAGFVLSSFSMPAVSAAPENQEQQKQKAQEPKPEVVIIPPEVKTVLNEGITSREVRLDIPFTFIWHSYLPARQNVHAIFFFKLKNADLGFVPVPEATELPEAVTEEKKEEAVPPETEKGPAMLQAGVHVFLQFNRVADNAPQEVIKEVYIPINLQVEAKDYDPDQDVNYSIGYPLPAGDYLLSMAVASLDLEKIGTQYFDFSLPDAFTFTDKIDTSPIFFIKDIRRMEAVETRAEVHKGFFTYSVLQIEPNIENIISARDNLDIFFFIYGAVPGQDGKHNIDVNYEVFKGEEKIVKYAPAHYETPLVSQPLPLKRTVVIKSETEEEKREQKDLDPGKYTLQIQAKDNNSELSVQKNVEFEIK